MVGTKYLLDFREGATGQATKCTQTRGELRGCMACVKKFSIINNIVLISTCSCSIMQSASFASFASFASLLVASLLKEKRKNPKSRSFQATGSNAPTQRYHTTNTSSPPPNVPPIFTTIHDSTWANHG
jgi:hypothetical protein